MINSTASESDRTDKFERSRSHSLLPTPQSNAPSKKQGGASCDLDAAFSVTSAHERTVDGPFGRISGTDSLSMTAGAVAGAEMVLSGTVALGVDVRIRADGLDYVLNFTR